MTTETPNLTPSQMERYSRHLLLPEIGVTGQERLASARVLLVGTGGLGSPAAIYLTAAGVGTLGLVDFDAVDATNLQRQILHRTNDVGRPKLDSAREALAAVNPEVQVNCHPERLSAANAAELISAYEVVIDGTDNFATRYLINDACVLLRRPNCYGSVLRFAGQVSVFGHPDGPCYRCLYPVPPAATHVPSCADAGVLGVLPGVIGTLQATEALKLLLGIGEPLIGRVLLYDALALRFRELRLARDPDCPVCGQRPSITTIRETTISCAAPGAAELSPQTLHDLLSAGQDLLLLDVRQPHEAAAWSLPGSVLIPLDQLADRWQELPTNRRLVVYCRSGCRSAEAVRLLKSRGLTDVVNLAGGMLRWCAEIENSTS